MILALTINKNAQNIPLHVFLCDNVPVHSLLQTCP